MTGFSMEVEGVARRLRDGMADGVLSFPLTTFRDDGSLDLESYPTFLTAQLATAPGAVFPACGTGEFSALDEDEYRAVIEATWRAGASTSGPASYRASRPSPHPFRTGTDVLASNT